MDRAAALRGSSAPAEILDRVQLIDVPFVDLSGARQIGQLVVERTLAGEVVELFSAVQELSFPIAGIVPIAAFGWDDDVSMAANNTSCFNYRLISGTSRMSMHSWGAAIDLNPAFNPYGADATTWVPPGARYDPERRGTLARNAPHEGRQVIELFEASGWDWLGDPDSISDRHHFQKRGFVPPDRYR
jgi:poly-gamma-glutamate synthesis protein (capsule biosynthesis protein)